MMGVAYQPNRKRDWGIESLKYPNPNYRRLLFVALDASKDRYSYIPFFGKNIRETL
jgi:hypothetical protein